MKYEVEYEDGQPTRVKFKPDPANSQGLCNHRLFRSAITRFCPAGWSYDGEYLSTRVYIGATLGDLQHKVDKAQLEVTDTMDMLDEFQNFLHAIKEYNAQSNPK